MALRAVRPPRRLEVFTDHGQPDFVRPAEGGNGKGAAIGCTGRVVSLAGPWRVRGEWWHEGAFCRDYYDVQLSDGGIYRLYCDERREWFVDGTYD